MTSTLTIATTRRELQGARSRRSADVGLVMTMGALHEGHAALIRAARAQSASVVVTIFVNPLQFGPAEDFAHYPQTLDADLELCAREGADLVFAPGAGEIYPTVAQRLAGGDDCDAAQYVTVDPGPLGDELEGAVRPGHLAGMLTVVNKMLHIVPGVERAYFGEKDYQQLVLIRRMARDFDLRPQIIGMPIVREPDGLALSSRNRYLDPVERSQAPALADALFTAAAAAATGSAAPALAIAAPAPAPAAGPPAPAFAAPAPAAHLLAVARRVLETQPALAVDYLELRSPDLGPAPDAGAARLLVAARLGTTRLIDNVLVHLPEHLPEHPPPGAR